MNLDSRLNQVEKALNENENLFPEMPDFNKWSEDQLNQYIVSWQNKFHIENKIDYFQDAKRILESNLLRS